MGIVGAQHAGMSVGSIKVGHLGISIELGDRNDRMITTEQWTDNVYRLQESMVRKTGVVVDVGANLGAFALYVAETCLRPTPTRSVHDAPGPLKPEFPHLQVYCYEPHPENFERLTENVEKNKDKLPGVQFFLRPSAVGTTESVVLYGDQTWAYTEHVPRSEDVPQAGGVQVASVSLDDLFAREELEEIDFLKVDIEGGEYPLFETATEDAIARVRFIAMEFHSATSPDHIGLLITKLMQSHKVTTLGTWGRGGCIYAERYQL